MTINWLRPLKAIKEFHSPIDYSQRITVDESEGSDDDLKLDTMMEQ